jgi:hypothetical protein
MHSLSEICPSATYLEVVLHMSHIPPAAALNALVCMMLITNPFETCQNSYFRKVINNTESLYFCTLELYFFHYLFPVSKKRYHFQHTCCYEMWDIHGSKVKAEIF